MIPRVFIFMLLALCSLAVRGQVSVTGKVRDAAGKDALAGAVVRVYSGGKLKAYASVGSDGDYRLKVPALAVDSLDVTVQCIGFSTVKRRIANRSAVVDFRLPAASTELREVSVSVPRINILGDTLVYNLASYLGKSDVTLEDGLKKLPGIEVARSGKISYQGKGISNFYIEGMDMLGGRYNMATRNLPADYVTDVQVLNNHHDAKIDKGAQTDDVALNIKLKSKVKFKPVGSSDALVGYGGKWLYRLGATGMMFTPKFQTMLSVKAGNFDEFAMGDLRSHISVYRYSAKKDGLASSALGNLGGSTPPLKSGRYISPEDRSVSLNFMNKLSDESSLKVNASYAYTSTEYAYTQTTEYYSGTANPIVIRERNTPFSHVHNPTLDLTYTSNRDDSYLSNSFSASGQFQTNDFNTLSDALDLRQHRSLRVFNLNDRFSWRQRIGERIWNLSAEASCNISPVTDLRVTDSNSPDESALQTLSGRTLRGALGGSTVWLLRGWRLTLPLSVDFTSDEVESLLDAMDSRNDVHGKRLNIDVAPGFEYTAPGRRFELSGNIGLRALFFHARNRGTGERISHDRPYVSPSVRFKYNFTPNVSALVREGYSHSIGDVLDLMTAPIMTSWRSRRAASGILARNRTFTSSLGIDFKNPFEFWFANADISYSRTHRNVLGSQYVTDSQVTVGGLANDNSSQSMTAMASVTKQWPDFGGKFTIGGSYSWSRSEMMQQDRIIPYFGRSFSLNPRFNLAPWRWVELNWKGSFTKTFSRYLGVHDSFDMMSNDFRLSFYPGSGIDLFGEAEIVRKQLSDKSRKNISLFDLGISYKIGKVKLTLRADNILDTRTYYYSLYSGLDTYTYTYSLRPRTVSLSVKFTK